jgi:prepilin-type N-terminal cleavage/methylation domain-containing protein
MNQDVRTSQEPRDAGFSLIEVMISMVLLAVAMLAIGAAQLRSLQYSAESANRSQAMYLAEEQLDTFMAMATNDLRLNDAGTVQDGANPIVLAAEVAVVDNTAGVGNQVPFRRSWTIEQNQPDIGMRRITVQVRWNVDPASPNSNLRMVQLQGVK